MAADFENMGYEAIPKTVSRIKIAAVLDLRVPEAVRPIAELKMADIFENMGFQAVPETFLGEKWPPDSMKGFLKRYDLSPSLKWPPIWKISAMKPFRRRSLEKNDRRNG